MALGGVTARMAANIDIQILDRTDALKNCEALQRAVWNLTDRDVVPLAQLRAAQHAGGLVAGAYDGAVLAGFVYGFPALDGARPTEIGLHSHMLGVGPAHRGRGIGRALKWFQRAWCLEHGYTWVSWTFDPLQGKNANLNLEHLGAVGVAYYRDFYGELGGDLAGEVATDRLLAWWPLDSARVRMKAEQYRHGPTDVARDERADPQGNEGTGEAPPAALVEADGEPSGLREDLDAPFVSIAAPSSTTRLFTHEVGRAQRWRRAQRAAFSAYLDRGYAAKRFLHGSYVLERNHIGDSS